MLKPSSKVLIAFAVASHNDLATEIRTEVPNEVSLHSTCTCPNPHVDAIELKSSDACLHPDFTTTLRNSTPVCEKHPILVPYAVEVTVVVTDEVAVIVALVVTVVTSQLLPNTPEARSVIAEFSNLTVPVQVDTLWTFK